jgi:hypothetical protein
MPRPVRITKALASASANNICLSQDPAAAGNLTLNGSAASGSPAIAVLDTARQILFTFAADETGKTFVVYGFDKPTGGAQIQETVAGAAATAVTTLGFGRIDRISIDQNSAGALTVGTNGVGWIPWQLIDWNLDPTNLVIAIDVVGTVNYTLQWTYDNILGEYDGQGNWSNTYPTKVWDDTILAAQTADGVGTLNFPATAWRVQINSGTGTLRIVGTQAGVGGVGS